nr:hypothetical protein [Candidatus Sigynarchaeota archaeon]
MSELSGKIGKKSFLARRKERDAKEKDEAKLYWAQAGFHRPLAGFWFNYALLLIIALPGILIIGVVLPSLLPYPDALGFNNVTTSMLAPIYLFADFGIKEACDKYISQYSEVNPRKAIRYACFYWYYQMFTGIIQVTLISFIAVTILPKTNMSYAGWFFLVYIMIQWPGTPALFMTCLEGFHRFDKANVIVVIQNVAIQTATQVGFILLGRWVGTIYPFIGPLMGCVMGFIFGSYLDDIIAMFIGAYMFKKVLEPFGLKLGDVLRIDFDKELMKEVLLFGGKVLPSGLSYVVVNMVITVMISSWLWNYSALLGLYSIGAGLVGALGVSFSTAPPISEAYNNNKQELSLFIIRAQFQWWGILSLGVLMAPLLFLIPDIVVKFAPNYAGVNEMVFPLFFGAFILFPTNFAGTICQACNLPQHSTFMNFIEQGSRVFFYFLALSPWTFRAWFGEPVAYWMWLFAEAPAYALKGFYGWYIIRKKLFPGVKIGFPTYQTLVAPFICMVPFALLYTFVMKPFFFVIYDMSEAASYSLAAIYLILILFIFPIFLIMPLYGWLGAWDAQSLEDFRKAALMAGPSRLLVKALYNAGRIGYKLSPFKGKFIVPFERAMKEASEITALRQKNELNVDKKDMNAKKTNSSVPD